MTHRFRKCHFLLGSLAMVCLSVLPASGSAQEQRLAGTLDNDGIFLAIIEDGGRQWLVSTGDMLGECLIGEVSADRVQLRCPAGIRELHIRALTERDVADQQSGEATYLSLQKDALGSLISDRQKLVNQLDLAPEIDDQGNISGWRVVSVRAGSEVESLGLQTGDLIIAVNHVAVADSVFMEALRSVPEQGLVNLTLQRQQKKIELIYSLH